MSNTLPILLAGSLFAGGAGAVAATVLMPPQAAAATDASVTDGNTEVLAAIDALAEQNRQLVDRIEALEIGSELAPVGGSAPRVAAAADRAEIEGIVKEVLGSFDGSDGTTTVATPAMQQAFESYLDLREERQRQERDQKRAEQEAKRMEDRLADLQTKLGLDQNQVNSMRTIFQDQEVRRDEMRDKMRAAREGGNMDFGDVRQQWRDMQEVTNTAVQGVLSPTQYEQYQQENNNRWGGDRGDRGGRRGGNDGGGNNGGGNNGGGRRGR